MKPVKEFLVPCGPESLNVRMDGLDGRPTLLLLHGFLGSLHWFDRLVDELGDGVHVIRVDLAGHGASTDNTDARTPADQAEYISRALGHLAKTPDMTIGHSLGADVAIALAERGVETGPLILLDEGPDYSLAIVPAANRLFRARWIGPWLWQHLSDRAMLNAVSQFFAKGFPFIESFSDKDTPVRDARRVSHRTFLHTQIGKEKYVAYSPLDDRLRALGRRTMVVFGSADDVFKVTGSLARYQKVPTVRVELLQGAGHSPMLEAAPQLAELISGFLIADQG